MWDCLSRDLGTLNLEKSSEAGRLPSVFGGAHRKAQALCKQRQECQDQSGEVGTTVAHRQTRKNMGHFDNTSFETTLMEAPGRCPVSESPGVSLPRGWQMGPNPLPGRCQRAVGIGRASRAVRPSSEPGSLSVGFTDQLSWAEEVASLGRPRPTLDASRTASSACVNHTTDEAGFAPVRHPGASASRAATRRRRAALHCL